MRYRIKTSTSVSGNTKTITTTKIRYITIRDLVGYAKAGIALAKALYAKKDQIVPMLKALGFAAVNALIDALWALALSLDIVKKILFVLSIVTPIAQLIARASGVWCSPGNVADIIQIVLKTVTKILIALALMAFHMLVEWILNFEIKIDEVSTSVSYAISQALTKAGNKIADTISTAIKSVGTQPTEAYIPLDVDETETQINDADMFDGEQFDGEQNDTKQLDPLDDGGGGGGGSNNVITGFDGSHKKHSFVTIIEADTGRLIAGSNTNEGLWYSDNNGNTWKHAKFESFNGEFDIYSIGNFKSFAFLNGYWYVGNNNNTLQNQTIDASNLDVGVNLRDAIITLPDLVPVSTKTGFSTITYFENTVTGRKGDFDLYFENNVLILRKLDKDYYKYPSLTENHIMLNSVNIGNDLNGKTITIRKDAYSNMAKTIIHFTNGDNLIFSYDKIIMAGNIIYSMSAPDSNGDYTQDWYGTGIDSNQIEITSELVISSIETQKDIKYIENNTVSLVSYFTSGIDYYTNTMVLFVDTIYKAIDDFTSSDFDESHFMRIGTLNELSDFLRIEDYNTWYQTANIGTETKINEILYNETIIYNERWNINEIIIPNDHNYEITEFYPNRATAVSVFDGTIYIFNSTEGTGIWYTRNYGESWNQTNINTESWETIKTISRSSVGNNNYQNLVNEDEQFLINEEGIYITDISTGEDLSGVSRVVAGSFSNSGLYYCNANGGTSYKTFNHSNITQGSFHFIEEAKQPLDAYAQGTICYSTKDVGLTWQLCHTYYWLCQIILPSGRIIAGSGNDTGLWYSDTNGLDWIQSSQKTGSWSCLLYYNNLVCAGSADTKGIMYSLDRGEVWIQSNVEYDQWTSFASSDKNAFAGSLYGTKQSEDGKYWYTLSVNGNTTVSNIINRDGKTNTVIAARRFVVSIDLRTRLFTYQEIDRKVIYVINYVVAPYLFDKLFGMYHNLYNVIGERITLKNGRIKEYVLNNEEIYQIDKFTSLINFKDDCGMQPIGAMSMQDIIGSTEIPDVNIYDFNQIQTTTQLQELVKQVKGYLNIRKEEFFRYVNGEIDKIYLEDNDILASVSSQEELQNAMNIKSMFGSALKDGSKALMQSFCQAFFMFDDALIKRLLIATVHDMIQNAATQLKHNFIQANIRMVGTSQDYIVDMEQLPIVLNFNSSLTAATNRYLRSMANNIRILNSESDKDIISLVCNRYKYIEHVELNHKVIILMNDIKRTPRDMINLIDNLNNFKENLKNEIIQHISLEDKDTRIALLNYYYNNYSGFIHNKESMQINILDMIQNAYLKMMNDLSTKLKSVYPQSITDWSELNSLTTDRDKYKYFTYMNEVIEQYRLRCKQLLYVVYISFTEEDKKNHAKKTYSVINNETTTLLNSFIKEVGTFLIKDDTVDIITLNLFIDSFDMYDLQSLLFREIDNFSKSIISIFNERSNIL